MREVSGEALAPLPRNAHLVEPLLAWSTRQPERPMAAYRVDGRFEDVTVGELVNRIRGVARGLVASGVAPGDRVALMSKTRLEWMIADYAILMVGGVTVPIYETSSAEQIQWIFRDSGAVLFLVENPSLAAMYDEIAGEASACRERLILDEGALDELTSRGQAVDDGEIGRRVADLTTDSLATLIYTSGTTGRPKGCVLTHGNLRVNAKQTLAALGDMVDPSDVGFMFLPLAHTLAKVYLLVGVEHGMKAAFATNMGRLVEEFPMVEPMNTAAVPRVFEKIFNGAVRKAHAEGKGAIFDRAADLAVRWSEQHTNGRVRMFTGAGHALFDRLVYSRLRTVFGGRLRFAFSGGGPLGSRLTHFFNGIGVKVMEGYGLTETSPVLSLNRSDAWRPGSVGLPVPGTTIRIADDGEILVKGPQVFGGYWQNEAATAETFNDEGWFRTGDVGAIDDAGFLSITGRKKELIVTSGGKNVAPAPLEDRLRATPLISQAVVVGDGRAFVSAILTLDDEAVAAWASDHGKGGTAVLDLVDDPELKAEVKAAVDAANASVSKAEGIRKYAILPRDLSIETGELTPTMKVRRGVVEKEYAHVIDALYQG